MSERPGQKSMRDRCRVQSQTFIALIACLAAGQAFAASSAMAQANSGGSGGAATQSMVPAWRIQPSLELREMYTDNVSLTSSDKQGSLVTMITPGVTLTGRTKRLNLHVNYGVTEYLFQSGDRSNRTANSLSGAGTLELVDNWLYLDGRASIAQQNTSPFGPAPGVGNAINSNAAEARNYSLAPYIRGHLLGKVSYELRYDHSRTNSLAGSLNKLQSDVASGKLASLIEGTRLGWQLSARNSRDSFSSGVDSRASNVIAMLTYRLDPQLELGLGGIHESNNYSGSKRSNGLALDAGWKPSPITSLTGHWQHESYGATYDLAFSHRTPLSEVTYRLSRGVTTTPSALTYAGFGGLYDLLYSLLASRYPDPTARADEVMNLINQYGLDPNSTVVAGFLQNQVTLNRRQTLSFVKRGVRNVVTLSLQHGMTSSLQDSPLFTSGAQSTRSIKQDGANLNWSHLLSAKTNLSASYTYMRSKGEDDSGLQTTQRTLGVNCSTSLGKRTTFSVGGSHIEFDSANSYNENLLSLILAYHY